MNTERLHAIADALVDDLGKTQAVPTLTTLREALKNQVNQPQQAEFQEAVASSWKTLTVALEGSATNGFSPAWCQAADEIGAFALTGDRLKDRIDEVFARNQITPSVALAENTRLHGEVSRYSNNISQLATSLAGIGIGADELDPGQAEVGVLVPRAQCRTTSAPSR